jgi:hypothetical protein
MSHYVVELETGIILVAPDESITLPGSAIQLRHTVNRRQPAAYTTHQLIVSQETWEEPDQIIESSGTIDIGRRRITILGLR